MDYAGRFAELGIPWPRPDELVYTGVQYGPVAPYRLVGNLLFLSGHLPERADGTVVHPGALGLDLSTAEGYEAARVAGINAVKGMLSALGDLNRVAAIVRSLNFVVCTPGFHDIHLVANGCSDVLREIFGDKIGIGGRATVGVMSLARSHCFETWLTVEVKDA